MLLLSDSSCSQRPSCCLALQNTRMKVHVSYDIPSDVFYPLSFLDIVVELASSEFFVTEGENLVSLLIRKSGETEQDVDVVLSLSDGAAKGTAREQCNVFQQCLGFG